MDESPKAVWRDVAKTQKRVEMLRRQRDAVLAKMKRFDDAKAAQAKLPTLEAAHAAASAKHEAAKKAGDESAARLAALKAEYAAKYGKKKSGTAKNAGAQQGTETGPRGGTFYVNASGEKIYVK
jgi:hypothetical protein